MIFAALRNFSLLRRIAIALERIADSLDALRAPTDPARFRSGYQDRGSPAAEFSYQTDDDYARFEAAREAKAAAGRPVAVDEDPEDPEEGDDGLPWAGR